MTKKNINESKDNIISRGISAIFNAVANKKMDVLKKRLMKDPEFKKSVEQLAKLRDEFDEMFNERYRNRKDQAEFEQWWNSMWNKKD